MEKEIQDKIGAMHERFLDDKETYANFINLMLDYSEHPKHYGQQVINALQNGLNNHERYLNIENALSPRMIMIEKSDFDKTQRAKGCYRVYFVMDDESVYELDSEREACHLLYILMLLCSEKNGLLADFFLKENRDTIGTVVKLVKLIYPDKADKDAEDLAKNLASNRLFTSTFQHMQKPIKACLAKTGMTDDLIWYMPYYVSLKQRKRLYKIRMPQPHVLYPDEFQPIANELPDAADFLAENGIQIATRDMRRDFAWYRETARQGDPEGLFLMGVYYGTGDIVSQDYKKSMKYFVEADQKGHLDATYQIGVYYHFGFGVEQDIRKALQYYEKAAGKGHAEAATYAAQLYARGSYGVEKDHEKAFNLYMTAAQNNEEEGLWYVIQGYLTGQGTPQNLAKAAEWFERAERCGYAKIKALYGLFFLNQGDKESLDTAYSLFLDACEAKVPIAFWLMYKMVQKGYCETDNPTEKGKEWLLKGAELGDKYSISAISEYFPETYKAHRDKWEKKIQMRDYFISLISEMDHIHQKKFIELTDAYREKWLEDDYLKEICKQLNIHKPNDEGESKPGQRRITVRRSEGGKLPYEVVLTLANGEKIVINSINRHCMVLYLLTIICSYKSGYTTKMAKSSECRPILKELVRLTNAQADPDSYVDDYMYHEKDEEERKNENYYKQYSNLTKNAIKKAVEANDEVVYFLFDNERIGNRQFLRRMTLSPEFIKIPPELETLAGKMPDALYVLEQSDIQRVNTTFNE